MSRSQVSEWKRAGLRVVIAVLLFPIIYGAIAEADLARREQFQRMRADHLRRIAIEREMLAERRAARAREREQPHDR